ncbi:PDZ domain-containing protein 4-like isoform X2 [Entelurus aequoreus]|uniref:PDZ domain-containing protein 4-like isoform X2 n=1 Tax=Entelurus aequoreus TaxID=161455 RepID=UPI002B1D7885|nr:PDZ domain-containing protein 4-like isoform X2 [Entelurus aequoreus]
MGCNMCVVKRPEEHCRVSHQQKGWSQTLRRGHVKLEGRLPLDRATNSQHPLQQPGMVRKGQRRKGGVVCGGGQTSSSSIAMATIPDCVDNATQTDISFQHGGRGQGRQGDGGSSPPPPTEHHQLCTLDHQLDHQVHHQMDHQLDHQVHHQMDHQEVALYKSSQEEKLGLTVCYRTEDQDHLGIYVGEVKPDGIAAKNGRIREGDRILQINGLDIQNREEAVAILSRDDSINFSLLLARPNLKDEATETTRATLEDRASLDMLNNQDPSSGSWSLCHGGPPELSSGGQLDDDEGDTEEGQKAERPVPLPPLLNLLSTSQDLDSGLGRTDDSTRYEESSEHDLLGDQTSACDTGTTNTPGSTRKFRPGPSPRLSPRPSPGFCPSPKLAPSPGNGRGDTTTPFLHLPDLQLCSDFLTGPDWTEPAHNKPQPHRSPGNTMTMPGLTADECQRYQGLLEIRYQYEYESQVKESALEEGKDGEEWEGEVSVSEHQMALVEEELRHLEFKCRNILRAQKMQQLRERCLKAWMMEEAAGIFDGDESLELSAINELPKRSNDSTGAYNSSRSTPSVSCGQIPPLQEEDHNTGRLPMSPPTLSALSHLPPFNSPIASRRRDRERRHSNVGCSLSPGAGQSYDQGNSSRSMPSTPSKFRSLSKEAGSSSRRDVADEGRGSKTAATPIRHGGGSGKSSPFLSHQSRVKPLERYQSCIALPSDGLVEPLDRLLRERGRGEGEERGEGTGSSGPASPRSVNSAPCGLEEQHAASRLGLALPLGLLHSSPTSTSQRMEWKVKIRSDGTRYVAKRPVRDRLLKARAMKIREERSGMTTDDDAASEMKQGRYWSKEERKQQLLRARENRRRREFMMQSRLDYLKGDRDASSSQGGAEEPPSVYVHKDNSILLLSQKRSTKKRNRRILDNWMTIQDLLAHGSRSPDGKKIFNPLLSVTTV